MASDPGSESAPAIKVFVISPIGAEGSRERERANRFLKYIVRVALPAPAYNVERADEHDSPHAITAAMLNAIVDADICVADISGRNPNVFYELALAHAMDKHVVIMDGDTERSPFDIQDQRAIKYGLWPEEIEVAVEQLALKAQAGDTPSTFRDMMNPVATALRVWRAKQEVAQSGDTSQQLLFEAVQAIRDQLDRQERTLPVRNTPAVSFMTERILEMLEQIDAMDEVGLIDPSMRHFINAGRDLVGSLPAERQANRAKLDLWIRDAEYLLDPHNVGTLLTLSDLPSAKQNRG